MFTELRKAKFHISSNKSGQIVPPNSPALEILGYHGPDCMIPPTEEEVMQKQPIINNLVLKRYTDQDNDFLFISEKNYFEQFESYKDTYPLFRLRMQLWYGYM
jgi:hypothetical protein